MIELHALEFSYPGGEFSLQIQDVSLAENKRMCWFGPSGSGKTTLLNLVAGIIVPNSGRVQICGEELTALGDAARRDFRIANVGLVFQEFALLDYLSVLDNILLPYRINGALQMDSTARARAQRLATAVGLGKMVSRRPIQLSQGERQRVAVCRALITSPKLLLADEPTANLDPANARLVLDMLEGYATENGATLIVVSHDRDVLARFDMQMDVSEFCTHLQQPVAAEGGAHA